MTVRPTPYVRDLPLGRTPEHCRQRIEALEHLLERALPITDTTGQRSHQAPDRASSRGHDVEGVPLGVATGGSRALDHP